MCSRDDWGIFVNIYWLSVLLEYNAGLMVIMKDSVMVDDCCVIVVQLMALSERCQSIEEELAVINNKLSCASHLITDLLR